MTAEEVKKHLTDEFKGEAQKAGFTGQQAQFMWVYIMEVIVMIQSMSLGSLPDLGGDSWSTKKPKE